MLNKDPIGSKRRTLLTYLVFDIYITHLQNIDGCKKALRSQLAIEYIVYLIVQTGTNFEFWLNFTSLKIFEMFSLLTSPINTVLYTMTGKIKMNAGVLIKSSCSTRVARRSHKAVHFRTAFLHLHLPAHPLLQPQGTSSLEAMLTSSKRVHIGFQTCGSNPSQSSAEGIHMVISNILPQQYPL